MFIPERKGEGKWRGGAGRYSCPCWLWRRRLGLIVDRVVEGTVTEARFALITRGGEVSILAVSLVVDVLAF